MSLRTVGGIALLLCLLAALRLLGAGRPVATARDPLGCWPGTPGLVLAAQSVPSSAYVPCVEGGPGLWVPTDVSSGSAEGTTYRLALRRDTAWTVRLQVSCDVTETAAAGPAPAVAPVVPSGVDVTLGRLSGRSGEITDVYRFPGGCVTSVLAVPEGVDPSALLAATRAALRLLPPPGRP